MQALQVQASIDKTVEKVASEKNVTLVYEASMSNQFSENKGFGGAGGVGNDILDASNVSNFFGNIDRNNIKEIHYTLEIGNDKLTKKYWALSSGGIFEYRLVYAPPVVSFMYSLKGYDADKVVFEKSIIGYFFSYGFSWCSVGRHSRDYRIYNIMDPGFRDRRGFGSDRRFAL